MIDRIKGQSMTFNGWLQTSPSVELKETAKELEVKLLKIAELAWKAGHDIGYDEGCERCLRDKEVQCDL